MRADRVGAHPEILEFERLLIKRLKKYGVPMFAHCVMRGEAEQNRVYIQGYSKSKWGQSAHNYGCAVDVIHGLKGWEIPRKSWEIIGHMGDELASQKGWKIKWGGTFKVPWDPAHWELENWKNRLSEIGKTYFG